MYWFVNIEEMERIQTTDLITKYDILLLKSNNYHQIVQQNKQLMDIYRKYTNRC